MIKELNYMFKDVEQWKYKVHTPKGDGTICQNLLAYHALQIIESG